MPTLWLSRVPIACAALGVLAGIVCATVPGVLASQAPPAAPTFTRDVAPIVFTACASCHRPTGSAPFSLLMYEDVRSRAHQIVSETSARRMPPWKPEPGYGDFAGDRRLTGAQTDTLSRWRDAGAPQGEPALLPPPPTWSGRWQLGEPDLVLETAPYTLRAAGDDMYRNFVLPIPGTGTRYIKAWEFLPGTPACCTMQPCSSTPAGRHGTWTRTIPSPATRG